MFSRMSLGFKMGDFVILVKLEMSGYILSTVATDGLMSKHWAISIHSADQISIALWYAFPAAFLFTDMLTASST